MANLSLTIDASVLRRAQVRALEERTSLDAVVRQFLENYAGAGQRVAAMTAFVDLAEHPDAGSRGTGGRLAREDIYIERTGRWQRGEEQSVSWNERGANREEPDSGEP